MARSRKRLTLTADENMIAETAGARDWIVRCLSRIQVVDNLPRLCACRRINAIETGIAGGIKDIILRDGPAGRAS